MSRNIQTDDRRAGALFVAFPLLVQIPFGTLVARFNYPDVLREPAGTVLTAFAEGGAALVLTWYAYAMSIGVFVAAVLLFDRQRAGRRTATWLALGAAAVQCVALLRWTFSVPALAEQYVLAADLPTRTALETLFVMQHSFLGIGLGEHLGQLLMAAWTWVMQPLVPATAHRWRPLGVGAACAFVLGLGEQLGTALHLQGPAMQVFAQLPMLAFLAWSVWLIAVGMCLLRQSSAGTASSL